MDECIICGGPVFVLGSLGDRLHVRCRHCGFDQSHEIAPEEVNLGLWEVEDNDEDS